MHEERFGSRDRTYSAWHRRMSTRRFVGIKRAQLLSMIDLDGALYCEFDMNTCEPLALIETAVDMGQRRKTATLTPAEWAAALVTIRAWAASRSDREASNDAIESASPQADDS